MNRVTIVNLAGSAWYVDDAGATALDAWLTDARSRLATDPDCDELIADFELAIADRFRASAPGDRDVVSADATRAILTALGVVESAEGSSSTSDSAPDDHASTASARAGAHDEPRATSRQPRRFYRLDDEEAMLGGVCAGIAAYANVDVTVVRAITVVLTIVTGGMILVGYLVIALIAPAARTPEQRAEAHGDGTTAQDMLSRARERATPALSNLGARLGSIFQSLGRIARSIALIALWVLIAAWVAAIGWLVVDSDAILSAFDDGTSIWLVGLWLTCVAWIPIGVMLAIERGLAHLTRHATARSRSVSSALTAAWITTMLVAFISTFAIPAATSTQLSQLEHGRGDVRLFHQDICVDVREDASAEDRRSSCEGADVSITDSGHDR